MNRLLALLVLAALAILRINIDGDVTNSRFACADDGCFAEAATSPHVVLLGIAMFLLAISWPRQQMIIDETRPVKIAQRMTAFMIDFSLLAAFLYPSLALIHLSIEALATGSFAWSFEREFDRYSDWVLIIAELLIAGGNIVSYFYFHSLRGTQTFGQYLLGYRMIVTGTQEQRHFYRMLKSFVGIGSWPLSLYDAATRNDKSFWWDRHDGMRAVRVISRNGAS